VFVAVVVMLRKTELFETVELVLLTNKVELAGSGTFDVSVGFSTD